MSLHRYVLPPPLALSITPAPPPKPKPAPPPAATEKDKDREKRKDDLQKGGAEAQEPSRAKEDAAKNDDKVDKNAQESEAKKPNGGSAVPVAAADAPPEVNVDPPSSAPEGGRVVAEAEEPITPASPGSMTPEPPTPAPGADEGDDRVGGGALAGEVKRDDETERNGEDGEQREDKGPTAEIPAPNKAKAEPYSNQQATNPAPVVERDQKKITSIKDITPEPETDEKAEAASEPEPEPEPEPLRLLPPAPPRPLRTRLELNPSKPYPPIYTDPRGAYHKYARAVGQEWILIDVTKDGWLAEQWKERTEREALKRLTGEWERELQVEMERQRKKAEIRQVPSQAEQILLQLWNELVEANNHEIHADEFWARYDWTTESARKHLSDYRRKPTDPRSGAEAEAEGDSRSKESPNIDAEKSEKKADEEADGDEEEEVEWTKNGLEEILATVGIQCAYNTPRPLGKSYAEPPAGYLLMSHSYFLLRNDLDVQWKPEHNAGKFEVLVTSGHDRVFGAMVKAQREKEYRERKMKERAAEKEKGKAKGKDKEMEKEKEKEMEKEKEKEKAAKKEGDTGEDGSKEKAENKGKDGEKKAGGPDHADKRGQEADNELKIQAPDIAKSPSPGGADEAPGTPVSNIKMHDGEPVAEGKNGDGGDQPTKEKEDGALQPEAAKAGVEQGAGAVAIVDLQKDVAMVAVPIEGQEQEDDDGNGDGNKKAEEGEGGDEDKNRDKKHEQEAVIVPGPKAPQDQKEENKKENHDGVKKNVPAADDGAEKPMNMGQIAQAFQALEAANNPKPVDLNAASKPGGEKEKVPLVWTWSERCETWRWKNYEAGLHDVRPGGWEERDWKVFADDREVWDFDADEAVVEVEEEDIHDWSF
ncbi:hypothetical protein IAU59_006014 [Kwoniella sp. CBS 9459]